MENGDSSLANGNKEESGTMWERVGIAALGYCVLVLMLIGATQYKKRQDALHANAGPPVRMRMVVPGTDIAVDEVVTSKGKLISLHAESPSQHVAFDLAPEEKPHDGWYKATFTSLGGKNPEMRECLLPVPKGIEILDLVKAENGQMGVKFENDGTTCILQNGPDDYDYAEAPPLRKEWQKALKLFKKNSSAATHEPHEEQ